MSTILKSLRKLEDEKSVLDKKVKLKDLVIQEDAPVKTVEDETPASPQWWMGAVLITAGITVGVAAVWLMQPNSGSNPGMEAPGPSQTAPTVESNSESPDTTGTQGVRLSSIPDFTKRPARPDDGVIVEEDVEPTDPVPGSMAAPVTETPAVEEATPPAPEPAPQRPQQASDQIISALADVPVQSRTAISPKPQYPVTLPVEVVEEIPGLKIKGIIFFGEGSPENYLFFTTPEAGGIHRLKVGEGVVGATLQAIHPGRALFDYGGRTVELRVGS